MTKLRLLTFAWYLVIIIHVITIAYLFNTPYDTVRYVSGVLVLTEGTIFILASELDKQKESCKK